MQAPANARLLAAQLRRSIALRSFARDVSHQLLKIGVGQGFAMQPPCAATPFRLFRTWRAHRNAQLRCGVGGRPQ